MQHTAVVTGHALLHLIALHLMSSLIDGNSGVGMVRNRNNWLPDRIAGAKTDSGYSTGLVPIRARKGAEGSNRRRSANRRQEHDRVDMTEQCAGLSKPCLVSLPTTIRYHAPTQRDRGDSASLAHQNSIRDERETFHEVPKHFDLQITDAAFRFTRKTGAIGVEAATDGTTFPSYPAAQCRRARLHLPSVITARSMA
jgi:hypothetical protein